MPTRRGIAVIVLGMALIAVGRVFAVKETIQVGSALLLLWAITALTLLRDKPSLLVTRDATTARLHLGESTTVTITVANGGPNRSPSVIYVEKVPSGTTTTILPRVKAGAKGASWFALTPTARGVSRIGPGKAFIEDPFRLARRTLRKLASVEMIVYPSKEELRPRRGINDSAAYGVVRAPAPASSGAEFFTIRPHQHGDDLRKVHWVSSARSRTLMIRQEEQHRHTSVSVVVDDSSASYKGQEGQERFERCLSHAASIIDLTLRRSTAVELAMKGSGQRNGRSKGSEHRHRVMEQLARAEPVRTVVPLETSLVSLKDRPDHLIYITLAPDDPTLIASSRRVGRLTLVLLEGIDDAESTHLHRAGIETLDASGDLASAWDRGAHHQIDKYARTR